MKTKKKSTSSTLAVVDTRHPVTAALAFAFGQGQLTAVAEKTLITDMQALVMEATKKFVNFVNVESVREALNIILGILSLPLARKSSDRFDPEVWAAYVQEKGLKEIAKEAIALVRPVAESPDAAQFEHFVPTPGAVRSCLIDLAISQDKKRQNIWNGYTVFQQILQSRKAEEKRKQLAYWLIRELVGCNPDSWVQATENTVAVGEPLPSIHEVINTLMFRHCCGLSIRGNVNLEISKVQFKRHRDRYDANPNGWTDAALARYEDLFEKIPNDLRSGLLQKGSDEWFRVYLSDGPPKAPKDWKDAALEGITGIYLYKMFGE